MRNKTPTLKKNLKDNNRPETDGNNFDKFLEIDFIWGENFAHIHL